MMHVTGMQSKFKAVKLSCRQRSSLLTVLFQCIDVAGQRSRCPIVNRVLG